MFWLIPVVLTLVVNFVRVVLHWVSCRLLRVCFHCAKISMFLCVNRKKLNWDFLVSKGFWSILVQTDACEVGKFYCNSNVCRDSNV